MGVTENEFGNGILWQMFCEIPSKVIEVGLETNPEAWTTQLAEIGKNENIGTCELDFLGGLSIDPISFYLQSASFFAEALSVHGKCMKGEL